MNSNQSTFNNTNISLNILCIRARFIQSVNELQHLGYIRPSKYKADHVQRLTCGSC